MIKPLNFMLKLEALRAVVYSTMVENMAYTHSIITVTPSIKIGGGKNYNQIVG